MRSVTPLAALAALVALISRWLRARTRSAALILTLWLARPIALLLSVYTTWQETQQETQQTQQARPVESLTEQPAAPPAMHPAMHPAEMYATPRLRGWARSLGFAVNDVESMDYYDCSDEQAGRIEEPDARGIQRLCRHMLYLIELQTPHLQEELARAVTSMLLLIGVSAVEREMSGRAIAQSDARMRALQDETEQRIAQRRAIERMAQVAQMESVSRAIHAPVITAGRSWYPHPPTVVAPDQAPDLANDLASDLTADGQYGDTYHDSRDTGEHRAGPFAPAR